MDYSKLSDAEIAAKVLIAQGYKLIDDGYEYSIYISKSGRKDIGPKASKNFVFDPCNNAADAWPIIENNKISITCHQSRDFWAAVFNRHSMASHANPLRAAMECYLMMQGDE